MKTETKDFCTCKHSPDAKNSSSKKILHRGKYVFKLALPVIGYALIPKCPVCLAGYLAVATGVGLSVTTATYFRTALIIICILSIAYFLAKHARRFIEVHKTKKKNAEHTVSRIIFMRSSFVFHRIADCYAPCLRDAVGQEFKFRFHGSRLLFSK